MSKTNETSAQTPDAAKKSGCCCGNHEKGHEPHPGNKVQSKPSDTAHSVHSSTPQADVGCCGGSKARK